MAFIYVGGQSALNPVATPAQRLPAAFSKKFLERLEKMSPEPFIEYATEYPVMQKSGYKVVVTLTSALSVNTTPIGDSDGKQSAQDRGLTTTNITMNLAFYGNDIGWNTLFDITSVDVAKETHSRELAMNARESLAQLMVDKIDALSTTGTGSGTFAAVVAAVRALRANKVRGFDELNGHICGVIGPYMWEDLTTEASAAYKDHYRTPEGSNILANGQLEKPAAGVQFFISNFNKTTATDESNYFWGDGALAKTELQATLAGADGRAIGLDGIASLVGYLIPARAELFDPYGLQNHAVWRAGPLAFAVADTTRISVRTISI